MNLALRQARYCPALLAMLLGIAGACDRQGATDPLAVTDAGIGPITKDTLFDADAIADLFPHLLVQLSEAISGDEIYPVISVLEGDQELFTIVPGMGLVTIFRVEISSPFMTLEDGATIGDSFAALLPGETVPDIGPPTCDRGLGELAHSVICRAPGHDHIYFLFEGLWEGPASDLPLRPVLQDWYLARILWVP